MFKTLPERLDEVTSNQEEIKKSQIEINAKLELILSNLLKVNPTIMDEPKDE